MSMRKWWSLCRSRHCLTHSSRAVATRPGQIHKCTRLAYIIYNLRSYVVSYNTVYCLYARPADGFVCRANSRALCLSRTSRRLTGINPGEMTRLIKQIGQNIIGSVVRPLLPPNAFRLKRRTDLMSVWASINPSYIYYSSAARWTLLSGSRD